MKNLLLMRHAKSDWSTNSSDFERPLNKRGKKDAPFMGRVLNSIQIIPDLIISSPARRTRETALGVIKGLNVKKENILTLLEEIYNGNESDILKHLLILPDEAQTVMLIGHNPTFENLVSGITSAGKLSVKLPTASVTNITIETETWSDFNIQDAVLECILIPKVLWKVAGLKNNNQF